MEDPLQTSITAGLFHLLLRRDLVAPSKHLKGDKRGGANSWLGVWSLTTVFQSDQDLVYEKHVGSAELTS